MANTLLAQQVIPSQVLPIGTTDAPKTVMPNGTTNVKVLMDFVAAELMDPMLDWTLEAYQVRAGGQPDELLSRTSGRGGSMPTDENDQPTTGGTWGFSRVFRPGNQCYVRAVVRNRTVTLALTLQYWS